jgi:hypothetical protein
VARVEEEDLVKVDEVAVAAAVFVVVVAVEAAEVAGFVEHLIVDGEDGAVVVLLVEGGEDEHAGDVEDVVRAEGVEGAGDVVHAEQLVEDVVVVAAAAVVVVVAVVAAAAVEDVALVLVIVKNHRLCLQRIFYHEVELNPYLL